MNILSGLSRYIPSRYWRG